MTKKMYGPSKLWRRSLCGLLVLLMMFSSGMPLTPAFAATKTMVQPGTEAPTVTVVAANINNEYLELGLSVNSQGVGAESATVEHLFQSVGAVLKYDADKLQPVNWSNATTPGTKEAGSSPFQTVLETKKANENTMATALTYTNQQVGYLYLAAEMARPQALYQALPAFAGNANVGGGGTDVPETASGEDAETPPTVEDRFVPVVLPKEDPTSLIPQVVTVRFQYVTTGEGAITDDQVAAAMQSIDLLGATDEELAIAAASPADGNISYFGGETAKRITANVQILEVKKGVSVDSGGSGPADPSSFFPIVFYDWDGVTLLGSKIVAKSGNATEQQKLIEAAMKEMQTEQSATTEQLDGKLWFDDPNLPLTYKKGYTFGKWIDFDAVDAAGNEVYTSYGAAVDIKNAAKMATDAEGNVENALPEPAGHVFSSKDYAGITVKAAYYTNDDMKPLTDDSNYAIRNYTISTASYLQFDATNNYSIKINIQRQNEKNAGVHRVRKLGLHIKMNVKGVADPIFALQELDNQDQVSTVVAVNELVDSVSFQVIDLCDIKSMGGSSNWGTGASGRSTPLTVARVGSGHGKEAGFVIQGALGLINEQLSGAASANDLSGIMAANMISAELNYSPAYGQTNATPLQRLNAVKRNLLAMYQSLPEKRDLNWEEMQEAIKRGTIWQDGGWTNGFTGIYKP